MIKFSFAEPDLGKKGAIAVAVTEGKALGSAGATLDARSGGALRRALDASKFTGRLGQILDVPGAPGIAPSHVVLYGLGKPEELREGKLEDVGGGLTAYLAGLPGNAAAI